MKSLIPSFFLVLFSFIGLSQSINLPYFNDFDGGSNNGWSHYALMGTDDWERGTPDYNSFNYAHSPLYVWGTGLEQSFALNSDRCLESPYFNLTDISVEYNLSFYHQLSSGANSNDFIIEYRVGHAGDWNLLNENVTKKSWQTSGGFSNTSVGYTRSAISLSFIQGIDSVKFRFRAITGGASGSYGWAIDDFNIDQEFHNLTAIPGDTIKGLNKNFTNFTLRKEYLYSNTFNQAITIVDRYYFSYDTIIDNNDILLEEKNQYIYSNSNQQFTYPLPPNLHAKNYYILYEYDINNELNETNESDNFNYTVLTIDTIIAGNYVDNFDSVPDLWNTRFNYDYSVWKKGIPNIWHIEKPRSGLNSWASIQAADNQILESPYLDLTSSINTTLCFWYKHNSLSSGAYLKKPYPSSSTNFPSFSNNTSNATYNTHIKSARTSKWDCFCESVSDYDGEASVKFQIDAPNSESWSGNNQTSIDDIYIGEPKADASFGDLSDTRFSSFDRVIDTLHYLYFNSGLDSMPALSTEFYWSIDSLLDPTDILLGTQLEPGLIDTSFVERTYTYTKVDPFLQEYFIIYKVDANESLDEMREYDNVGYFKYTNSPIEALPYYNDFENNITNWSQFNSLGASAWQWGEPIVNSIEQEFIQNKAFATGLNGLVGPKTLSHLVSPTFNLSDLNKPVIEFDFINYDTLNSNLSSVNKCNILYSINGGATWELLEPVNNSYKKWYTSPSFESIHGGDPFTNNSTVRFMYGKENTLAFGTSYDYIGRNYDDIHHYILDMSHLQAYSQVKFMFVYSNNVPSGKGVTIDNFKLSESFKDYTISDTKNLLVSSSDEVIRTHFMVKNTGVIESEPTVIKIYCSVDNVLDASDIYIQSDTIPAKRPHEKHLVHVNGLTPDGYQNFNYLICQIDPDNFIDEIDESNNEFLFNLAMDSSNNYEYPMEFDFEEDVVDGWTWHHDSTGYRWGHRYSLVNKYGINSTLSQMWGLDPQDAQGFNTSYTSYPIHYLESPSYDFDELSIIKLEFDIRCIGTQMNDTQGGNLSYSIDGGLNWVVLSTQQDPQAENWYDISSVNSLGGQPGWGNNTDWQHSKYDLTFLNGQSNIRFRFAYKSNRRVTNPGGQGLTLDNFNINASYNDLIAINTVDSLNVSVLNSSFPFEYNILNQGNDNIPYSKTLIYWSTDSIIDNEDVLLYEVPEDLFGANSTNSFLQSIYYPTPIDNYEYYVIYHTDGDSTFAEPNNDNNIAKSKIIFDDTSYVDLFSKTYEDTIIADISIDHFPFDFSYFNLGNYFSELSDVKVYWSLDATLDPMDVLLYEISEPSLNPLDSIHHAGDLYFPFPIDPGYYYLIIESDSENDNVEILESNNLTSTVIAFNDTQSILDNKTDDKSVFINNQLVASISFINEPILEINLLNAFGQIIQSSNNGMNGDNIQIESNEISQGIYFIQIVQPTSQSTSKFYFYVK